MPEILSRLSLLLLIGSAIVVAADAPPSTVPSSPPNVVVIFTDDQGYGDVGCYGARYATPHLDQLAKDGTRFTSFHVAQAVCSASRSALLTGCYPNRIGFSGALGPKSQVGLADGELTIAEMLKACGYATAAVGKWHLGDQKKFLPTHHGFDSWYGLPYSNDMWPQHPTTTFPDLPLMEGDRVLALNPDQTRLTGDYTARAVSFIEANHSTPFFLYVAHSMPHVPLFVSERFKNKSGAGLYGDVISEIDWSVGEVLATLDRLQLRDNTLVIFTSDNGPWLSYGDHAGSAGGLREGKGCSFEGGTRVPCMMRWPGHIPAGRVSDDTLMTIDLLPTIARLCGGTLPTHRIDGKDVWPLISGETGATNPHAGYAMYYNRNDLQAILSGHWKLVLPHRFRSLTGTPGNGGKPGGYSMVEAPLALYDLTADRAETTDVAAAHPAVLGRLQALAESFRADLGDDLTKRQATGARPIGRSE
ncbi:MAG: sulfatase [Planctomycetes bacterium]|nr:sulfatase [Planctomycetota bacterium]